MEEKETVHWADKYAEEVVQRDLKKKEYIVEAGITPSGSVHAGNFREIMTQDLIYKALLDKGVKAKYYYYWDDYDRFRKVPDGVDKRWEEYIEMPLFKVPDPDGCHNNYAKHYETPLLEENKACGVMCVYLNSSEEYARGIYSDLIKIALENSDKIKKILEKFRADELVPGWLPVEVYCEKCWKDTTTVKYLGDYKVAYTCECGNSGEIDFRKDGNVKLRWRTDWPMRWTYYGVDFESSGKDHKAAGGSWDTGVPICKEVFKHEPPIGPMYEFVYFKGQSAKMSKSVGNVVKVRQLLEVYEPELIRYPYTTKINKAFEISFDADLLNAYNYFDDARKMYYDKIKEKDKNEVRKYFFSKLTDKYVELPQFSVCVNVIQIALGDINRAKETLKKIGHPYQDADSRLEKAWKWVQDYAPDQFKFVVQEKMPQVKIEPDVKELLSIIADKIGKITVGEEIQQVVYNTAKEKNVPLEKVFSSAYLLFLGKEKGPRLGTFLASLDREFVLNRLKMKA